MTETAQCCARSTKREHKQRRLPKNAEEARRHWLISIKATDEKAPILSLYGLGAFKSYERGYADCFYLAADARLREFLGKSANDSRVDQRRADQTARH